MKTERIVAILGAFLALAVQSFAHCDGLDGPVVQAAQKALETKNVNLVLIWVQKPDEGEIKRVFEHTLTVRRLSAEARELADRFFFETLVRVHRAGEGAAFTGLKPAGRELGAAIPAADKALRDGKLEPVSDLLIHIMSYGLKRHFDAAFSNREYRPDDVEAGRAFVKAYVEYIHFVEALHASASGPAHGHFAETAEAHDHR
jgi:hypothetical protein